jgi:5'(3')-deoxyribonucleotidase
MIDDHFKNLDNFDGETIMFIQPHNINNTITIINVFHRGQKLKNSLYQIKFYPDFCANRI